MLLISVCTKRSNHPSTLLSECKKTLKKLQCSQKKKACIYVLITTWNTGNCNT